MPCTEQFFPADLTPLHGSDAGAFCSSCPGKGPRGLQHSWSLNLWDSGSDAQWGIGGVNWAEWSYKAQCFCDSYFYALFRLFFDISLLPSVFLLEYQFAPFPSQWVRKHSCPSWKVTSVTTVCRIIVAIMVINNCVLLFHCNNCFEKTAWIGNWNDGRNRKFYSFLDDVKVIPWAPASEVQNINNLLGWVPLLWCSVSEFHVTQGITCSPWAAPPQPHMLGDFWSWAQIILAWGVKFTCIQCTLTVAKWIGNQKWA